uniref:Protein kinase domain-containing protein n=2 Tax=Oryza nivara TaxID=4536 RepID=A0A0E0GZN9_ORYNI
MASFHGLLEALLWSSVAGLAALLAVGAALPPPPGSNCSTACGGINVSYPFGFEPGCSWPGFELSCRDTKQGKKLFLPQVPGADGYFEVASISLLEGQARVWSNISRYCYNHTSKGMTDDNYWNFVYQLPDTYRLSETANMLTVIGCSVVAYISVGNGDFVRQMSGCFATCSEQGNNNRMNLSRLANGTCDGVGCCQSTISKAQTFYNVYFDGQTYNTTGIYNISPCSYAVLMESSSFTFHTSYATSSEFFDTQGGRAPLVIDWAIRNTSNCAEAMKHSESYACISSNATCVDSSNGPGYTCNCTQGFQGNPYLRGGCQDIDECREPTQHSCYGNCINLPGTFECSCPPGTRGNASVEGACQKNLLTPGVQVTIGVVACVLAGLFGFLGCEVIRHKQRIRKQVLLRQTDEFFQQHGGQLLLEMMKVEGNVGFTLYERGQIEIATNNFHKSHIVGEGGQGTVYMAELNNTIVALKRCKEIDESRKMDFMQELVILCRVNHPHVVKLLGCCLQFEAPILVYEFVQNRTLQELLNIQRNRRFHVTLGTRLRIAAESAGALAHLHSLPHPILHGDVKPANILLAEGLVAKVSDFGCSTIDEKTQAVPKGTPGYIDPDYLLEYQLTAKNDVYSFGVILLELLTGKKSLTKGMKSLTLMFQEAMANGTLIELLDSDIVDEASMRVIHQAAVLASQCLVVPGTGRPPMMLVAEELRRLALADEVQRYPQPPLVLEHLSFMDTGSTTSIWYNDSKTSGVYSHENKAVVSTEFAR